MTAPVVTPEAGASDRLDGVVLVVGGSGGVGRAIATLLASRGADVVVTYRTNPRVPDGVGPAVRCDLTDAPSVAAAVATAAGRGPLRAVVYAAGPAFEMGWVGQVPAAEWRRVVDTDVHGFFDLVQAALPHLRSASGSLVAISTAGLGRHVSKDILSIAPKAAVEALVRAVAREEGRFGVRANSVRLGVIDAGMFHRFMESHGSEGGLDERWVEAATANTPLGRFGTAEEVAETVAFLVSERASYLTGQTLKLDGGFSL